MSADKTKGVDSFRTVPAHRAAAENRPSTADEKPAAVPLAPPALEPAAPTMTPVKPTGKALRAAIAKSNKELDDAPVAVTTYGAERRKAGTAGLWGETDVTDQVLAKTANKG